jgi:hypothetical protein
MDKNKKITQQSNEGEGNRTAAREYNEEQQRFVRSGQVDRKAREAERDLNDREIRRELEHAEAVGRRHAADEDPEVSRPYKETGRSDKKG